GKFQDDQLFKILDTTLKNCSKVLKLKLDFFNNTIGDTGVSSLCPVFDHCINIQNLHLDLS
ncbi:hypothetical protein ABPG73_006776, partial [Tetrahymena malaccensis]